MRDGPCLRTQAPCVREAATERPGALNRTIACAAAVAPRRWRQAGVPGRKPSAQTVHPTKGSSCPLSGLPETANPLNSLANWLAQWSPSRRSRPGRPLPHWPGPQGHRSRRMRLASLRARSAWPSSRPRPARSARRPRSARPARPAWSARPVSPWDARCCSHTRRPVMHVPSPAGCCTASTGRFASSSGT